MLQLVWRMLNHSGLAYQSDGTATTTSTLTVNIEDDSPLGSSSSVAATRSDNIDLVLTGTISLTGTTGKDSSSLSLGGVTITAKGFADANLVLHDAQVHQSTTGVAVNGTSSNWNVDLFHLRNRLHL